MHDTTASSRPAAALPTRAQDWRALLQLAWPMLVGQAAQVAMGVADTVMAGAVSATDLAAVAVGFSLWLPLMLLGNGIFTAVTAMTARALGAGDRAAVATIFQQGVWLALLVGGIIALLTSQASALLAPMGMDAAVRPLTELYLLGMACGLPAAIMAQVLRGFSEGSGRSKPVMVINVCALLINIPLNYVFIHGLFGAPKLGGAGCGFATACAMWFQLLALAALLYPRYRGLLANWKRPQWRHQWAILYLGFPIGGAIFAEASIFALVALLIGHLGATIIASHQIALNFSALVFMVPTSLGLALTVKISNAVGAGERLRARRFAKLGATTSAVFATLSATLMLVVPQYIVALYTDDPAVRLLTAQLFMFAAAFQLSDGLQVTASGSLRGYHDTRVVLVITLIAYWGVGLPLGYALGLTDLLIPRMGVKGLWVGLVAGLTMAALLLNWRLARISRIGL